MDKALDLYDTLGFVCTPLNKKVPILKKWNTIDHTPDRTVFKNRNIGVLTGKASKITVLDIDIQDNGLSIWKKISSVYPDIDTPMVRTPNGGLHLYFKYNKSLLSTSKLLLRKQKPIRIGWDILNDNRQAVLPPSIGERGKKYKWLVHPSTTELIAMPNWLLDYINLSSK